MMMLMLTLMTAALIVASVGAFSLYTVVAPTAAVRTAKTTTARRFLSSAESSVVMPVAEDKMPFYALGVNLAIQAGGDGFKDLLEQDELEIALEAFCTNLRSSCSREYNVRTILTTYGPELNKILQERSSRLTDRIKKDGQFFIESYLSSFPDAIKTDSGLVYHETQAGTGERPTIMSTVEVHYHGTLTDGTVFDSSVDRGQPNTFPLNAVVPGFGEGLMKLQTGGSPCKATFVIPSDLAYGDQGSGSVIPPGATLMFEVELLKVLNLDEEAAIQAADADAAATAAADELLQGETEVIELPDGTRMRVPKGVKVRLVDKEEE